MKLNSQTRILLLDDETEHRSRLASTLAGEGYQVAQTDNSLEAINLHVQKPFDIIVIELIADGRDGFETLKALTQKTAKTRFIATAKTRLISPEISLSMARQLGAHFSLPRPFRHEELLTLVRKALD